MEKFVLGDIPSCTTIYSCTIPRHKEFNTVVPTSNVPFSYGLIALSLLLQTHGPSHNVYDVYKTDANLRIQILQRANPARRACFDGFHHLLMIWGKCPRLILDKVVIFPVPCPSPQFRVFPGHQPCLVHHLPLTRFFFIVFTGPEDLAGSQGLA